MPDLSQRPTAIPSLSYKDPAAAFEWLQNAFGFEPAMLITDAGGTPVHCEMIFGDGWIMIGGEWSENHRSPASVDGKNTQTVHLHMTDEVDAHCERARAAGAEILMEPETQFYGDRTYRARDPEGHIWTFARTVEEVAPEDWDRKTGLKTRLWP